MAACAVASCSSMAQGTLAGRAGARGHAAPRGKLAIAHAAQLSTAQAPAASSQAAIAAPDASIAVPPTPSTSYSASPAFGVPLPALALGGVAVAAFLFKKMRRSGWVHTARAAPRPRRCSCPTVHLARRSAGSLVQRGYLDENRGKADPFYNGERRSASARVRPLAAWRATGVPLAASWASSCTPPPLDATRPRGARRRDEERQHRQDRRAVRRTDPRGARQAQQGEVRGGGRRPLHAHVPAAAARGAFLQVLISLARLMRAGPTTSYPWMTSSCLRTTPLPSRRR